MKFSFFYACSNYLLVLKNRSSGWSQATWNPHLNQENIQGWYQYDSPMPNSDMIDNKLIDLSISNHKILFTSSRMIQSRVNIFGRSFLKINWIYHKRPHKRGLEQNCLPFALRMAITPAVTPANNIEDR